MVLIIFENFENFEILLLGVQTLTITNFLHFALGGVDTLTINI